jgi:hypothetical protein
MAGMPQLTRKCVCDQPARWHVHYDGVRVGVIMSDPETRFILTVGNGAVASTPAAIRAKTTAARPLTSHAI